MPGTVHSDKYKRPEDAITMHFELRMDNFLIPAFLRGTIGSIIHVSDQNLEEITVEDIYKAANGQSVDYISKSGNTNETILFRCYEQIKGQQKSITRFTCVEDYLTSTIPSIESKILDLDLDYFNDSTTTLEADLKEETVIRANLQALKEQCDWDVLTVALSPLYCSGEEECKYLFNLFLEEFDLLLKILKTGI